MEIVDFGISMSTFVYASLVKAGIASYSPRSNVHQEEATENMKIFPKFRITTVFAQSTSILLFGIPQYVELVIFKTRGSMVLES